ncbi:DUF1569 domain-containing protein [Brumimicrobium mesophilum]|uniref:DUF1569 domain-containing protein n=1 Tax=Brumimicrobium mesophilum TaxID=392717 RepID=UPI000D13EB93|nr:DUF1569 domain-containing protein [Brumimicrobium mesophilum]
MKSIFDQTDRSSIIERIEAIDSNHTANWGKMNVYQMVKHNVYRNDWILGNGRFTYYHAFIGKIFGKMVLKKMIKDEKPFDKSIPTSAPFKIKELDGDLESDKLKWISTIIDYKDFDNPDFIHDFFGKMTKEQIGILVYKHCDHHLRQFGL